MLKFIHPLLWPQLVSFKHLSPSPSGSLFHPAQGSSDSRETRSDPVLFCDNPSIAFSSHHHFTHLLLIASINFFSFFSFACRVRSPLLLLASSLHVPPFPLLSSISDRQHFHFPRIQLILHHKIILSLFHPLLTRTSLFQSYPIHHILKRKIAIVAPCQRIIYVTLNCTYCTEYPLYTNP